MSNSEMVDSVEELRTINSLVYTRPASGSLVSSRQQKLSFPASLSYSLGSTISFIINSGSESVWGPTSYLKVKVTAAGAGGVSMVGSLFNLFSSVRLYHKSGELLEQIVVGSDILTNIKLRYQTSYSDYQKLASIIGANAVPGVADTCGLAAGQTSYYNLPLSLLFGVFNNHTCFIPSQLIAGARMEFVLNANTTAMGTDGATLSALTEITPVLSLDCARLYSECERQLMEESASVQSSGLQFTYSTYFSSQSTNNGGSLNIDVLQSASLTERVFLVNTLDSGANKYNFKTLQPAGAGQQYSLQFRLGSTYLPTIYPIQDDTEAFQQAQIAFGGAYSQHASVPSSAGVSVYSFARSTAGADTGRNAVYASSLEKSASGVQLSGSATNNSQLISVNASNTKAAENTVSTVFLQYVRVANIMLDSCVVDR